MNTQRPRISLFGRIGVFIMTLGPGIFGIGHTIGTGSVTSMAKAGSLYGMELLWVLVLSCLFSWVLMEAFGRYAVVTGETALHGFKTHFRYGRVVSLLILVGVTTVQWGNLSGLIGLTSNGLYEALRLFIPGLPPEHYWAVVLLAAAILLVLYGALWVGRYSFFEKILVFFVTLMGLSFILSMFIVLPAPGEIAAGLIPRIPNVPGAKMMVAAFVGTTMAAPTFVMRPLLMRGKGWTTEQNLHEERRDAFSSALLMFIISGSVMVCATGALFHQGLAVTRVLDMANALAPVAGRFAVALFLFGTVSAGMSSALPIMMIGALLVSDYRAGEFDSRSPLFRTLAGIAALIGLTVPVLGANPIAAQIATQITGVFVLPLVVGAIFFAVNSRRLGVHRAGILLNTGIIAAFVFACFISWTALMAVVEFFVG